MIRDPEYSVTRSSRGIQMNEHPKKYPFFVDGKQFESTEVSITGAKVKAIAGIDAGYQVFLEQEGSTPDKPISDLDGVDLSGREMHFFAVPPATFGSR
jgi:hypothetical protein